MTCSSNVSEVARLERRWRKTTERARSRRRFAPHSPLFCRDLPITAGLTPAHRHARIQINGPAINPNAFAPNIAPSSSPGYPTAAVSGGPRVCGMATSPLPSRGYPKRGQKMEKKGGQLGGNRGKRCPACAARLHTPSVCWGCMRSFECHHIFGTSQNNVLWPASETDLHTRAMPTSTTLLPWATTG